MIISRYISPICPWSDLPRWGPNWKAARLLPRSSCSKWAFPLRPIASLLPLHCKQGWTIFWPKPHPLYSKPMGWLQAKEWWFWTICKLLRPNWATCWAASLVRQVPKLWLSNSSPASSFQCSPWPMAKIIWFYPKPKITNGLEKQIAAPILEAWVPFHPYLLWMRHWWKRWKKPSSNPPLQVSPNEELCTKVLFSLAWSKWMESPLWLNTTAAWVTLRPR